MRFGSTFVTVVIASLRLLTAQHAPVEAPLRALSGSIRSLTDRVSPAVVEIEATGYSTVDDEKGMVLS